MSFLRNLNLISQLEKHPKIMWIITIIYAMLIFYLSSIPITQPPSLEKVLYISTIEHIIEYTILGFLLFVSLKSIKKDSVWAVVLIGFLYGASDEIHQFFTPGRFCDILDVFADFTGVLIGVFIGRKMQKK